MPTATLQSKMNETLARLDKACGKSFIAENQKCTKQVVGRSPKTEPAPKERSSKEQVDPDKAKSALTRNLVTAGGIAMVGGVLVGLNLAKDVLNSELPASAKCPPKPPKGLYDSFTPGDLIYTSYEMDGITRAHYGVYMGKDAQGNHTLLHTTAKEEDGKITGSHINKMTLDDAAKESSFRKAGRADKSSVRPSTEQLHKLAEELNGRNYDWDGFENNCETFARSLVNDLPVSLQGQKVSKFNRILVSAIVKGTVGKDWDRKNAVTPKEVTERVKAHMKGGARTDKACGKSFIANNQKCSKPTTQHQKASLNNSALYKAAAIGAGAGFVASMLVSYGPEIFSGNGPLPDDARDKMTKALTTAAGVAVMGATLGVLGRSAYEINHSYLSPDSLPPKVAPEGFYDTLRPGDIIYKGIDFAGGQRAHYAVYYGKVNGVHKVVDTRRGTDDDTIEQQKAINRKITALGNPKTPQEWETYNREYQKLGDEFTRVTAAAREQSAIGINDMGEAKEGETSYGKAKRLDPTSTAPTTEQFFKLVAQLEGKSFDWTGFENNCETFSRALVHDLPTSSQASGMSKLTADLTHALLSISVLPKSRKGFMSTKQVYEASGKAIRGDAMNPKAQAEQLLSPLFGGRPVSVMSVSLSPEGNPIGVFRGEPRPGQTHYYTFKAGQTVQFKRIQPKKDSGCGCEACQEKSGKVRKPKEKSGCGCEANTDGLTKTHKVMREFKNGTLTSHGKPVTDRKQAIAIALSEQSRVKRKKRPVEKGEAFEKVDAMDSTELSSLERNGDGKVYYQGRWWKPNHPVPSTAKGKKKMVLAVKDGKVKVVHFGAEGYGHNYSESARKSYMARSGGIKGTNDKHSANYWARKVLWAGKGGSVAQPKSDAQQKADALLERLDKKCGNSGVPDTANCKKGAGAPVPATAAQIHAAFVKKATAEGRQHMNQEEGEAYTKARIKEHYQKQATKKRTAKRVKGTLTRLALAAAAGGAVGLAGAAAVNAAKRTQRPKSDALVNADALLERLDKKCGNSGVPDGANCKKGGGAPSAKGRKGHLKNIAIAATALGALTGIAVADRIVTQKRKAEANARWEELRKQQAETNKQWEEFTNAWGNSPKGSQEWAQWRGKQAEETNNARRRVHAELSKRMAAESGWHKVLGVDANASASVIKAAFRKKAKESHPDTGGSPEAFAKVQKAWENAQVAGKVKRGDSIEMQWFVRRLDALGKVAV